MTAAKLTWRKSSRCNADGCVEVAEVGDKVAVAKDGSHRMTLTRQEFRDFAAGIRAYEFADLEAER